MVFFPLELSKGDFDHAGPLIYRVTKISTLLLIAGIICGKWNTVWGTCRRAVSALWREFVTHE